MADGAQAGAAIGPTDAPRAHRDWDLLVRLGPFLGLVLIGTALSVLSPDFLTASNLINVARQVSINAIIGAGMTLVMIAGGFDLSVGSIMSLTGVLGIMAMNRFGDGLGALLTLAAGAACGLVNGVMVAYGRINAFVATLAGMTIFHGIALVVTESYPVERSEGWYRAIGQGYLAAIPIPIYLMATVFLGLYLVLTRTTFGTAVYAVGGNEEAARLSGINVPRVRLAVFMLCGLCTAFATLILMARLSSAQANMGIGAELDAISAVVIGGTSLGGGEGTAVGTLIGAFIIGFINNGLNLLNISAHYQLVAKGVVIAGAVILDRQLLHRR